MVGYGKENSLVGKVVSSFREYIDFEVFVEHQSEMSRGLLESETWNSGRYRLDSGINGKR